MAMVSTAESGRFEVLWAAEKHARSRINPSKELFKAALREQHYKVFEWLVRKYGQQPELSAWLRRGLKGWRVPCVRTRRRAEIAAS